MSRKIKRTYKVELTFARPSAISDKQIKELLLDNLVDLFGEICIENTGAHLPAYITEIKVVK